MVKRQHVVGNCIATVGNLFVKLIYLCNSDHISPNAATGSVVTISGLKNVKLPDKGLDVIARVLVEKLLPYFIDASSQCPQMVVDDGWADPLFNFALLMTFAESTVVCAVDTRSPHDGFSREGSSSVMDAVCTWFTFICNGISGMTRSTSRQGRFNASDEADAIQNFWLSTLSLVSQLCSGGAQSVMQLCSHVGGPIKDFASYQHSVHYHGHASTRYQKHDDHR